MRGYGNFDAADLAAIKFVSADVQRSYPPLVDTEQHTQIAFYYGAVDGVPRVGG